MAKGSSKAGGGNTRMQALRESAGRVGDIQKEFQRLSNNYKRDGDDFILSDGTRMSKKEHDDAVRDLNKRYLDEMAKQKKLGVDTQTGKVLQFPGRQTTQQSSTWDYRGEKTQTDKIIDYANKATTLKQTQRAATALYKQDKHLTTLIEQEQGGNVDVKGDVNVLLTQRRRVRQALKKIER